MSDRSGAKLLKSPASTTPGVALPVGVNKRLFELVASQSIISLAFDAHVVDEDAADPGAQRDASAAAGLEGIELPSETCLIVEDDDP